MNKETDSATIPTNVIIVPLYLKDRSNKANARPEDAKATRIIPLMISGRESFI